LVILYSAVFEFTLFFFVDAKLEQKPQGMVFPAAQTFLLIGSISETLTKGLKV